MFDREDVGVAVVVSVVPGYSGDFILLLDDDASVGCNCVEVFFVSGRQLTTSWVANPVARDDVSWKSSQVANSTKAFVISSSKPSSW